jgi:hypothetical protein
MFLRIMASHAMFKDNENVFTFEITDLHISANTFINYAEEVGIFSAECQNEAV